MMWKYEDLFRKERPQLGYPLMDRQQRAKQFMPFAALKGYDQGIEERGEVLCRRPDLSEEEREQLDAALSELERLRGRRVHPIVRIAYFEEVREDGRGRIREMRGTAAHLELTGGRIQVDRLWIRMEDVLRIEIEGKETASVSGQA